MKYNLKKLFTDRYDTQILKWVGGAYLTLFLVLGISFRNTPPNPIVDGIVHSYKVVEPLQPLVQPAEAVFDIKEPVPLSNVQFTPGNDYDWGNCTWYVASVVKVPAGLGNAADWAANAKAMGFTVSSTPDVGSVAQTSAGYYGHVAVVVRVEGDQVVIREMNSLGLGIVDERSVPVSTYVYISF